MFKVSFKKESKKVETFNNKVTVVTLVGHVAISKEMYEMFPSKVSTWMFDHRSVDVSLGFGENGSTVLRLELSGKAVCSEEDAFDAVVGERIAESKAKIRLYRFMHTLLHKLYAHFITASIGDYAAVRIEKEGNFGGVFEVMGKYQGLLVKESHHLGQLLLDNY
jgi:hypothetical protein